MAQDHCSSSVGCQKVGHPCKPKTAPSLSFLVGRGVPGLIHPAWLRLNIPSPAKGSLKMCYSFFPLCSPFFFIQSILRNDSFNLRCKWLTMLPVLPSENCLCFNRFKAFDWRGSGNVWAAHNGKIRDKRRVSPEVLGPLKSCLILILNRRPTQPDNSLKIMKLVTLTYVARVNLWCNPHLSLRWDFSPGQENPHKMNSLKARTGLILSWLVVKPGSE